jgi:hypothetical protein
MLEFCFVSAVICPSLLIGVTSVLSVFIYEYKNLKQHVMKEQRSASLQVLYRKNDTEPTI